VPVIDHWWQTETGWPIGANCLGIERLPVKHGSCARAAPGWDVRVVEADAIGEAREASLWYSGKLAGEFQAAIGWSDVNVGPEHRVTIGGSAAWLHTSGFNVAASWSERDLGGTAPTREATHWSAAVGYKFGQHALALKYEVTEDLAALGDEATGIGFGYVWTPIRWAEFYAGYIMFELDRPNVALNDITVIALGTRIRF